MWPIIVITVLVWIIWSILNADAARRRGWPDGGAFFAMSMFLSPFLVWTYLMAVPAKPRIEQSAGKTTPQK